ncbi:MAG: bifunctional riboflavin kinase/FAD synthetase [Thermomicrobiales bacterium]
MTSAPAHVIDRFASVGNAPSVVTIGNFDGVHLGHQYLLDQVTRRARELDVRPLIVTFEPHPVSVLRPDQPMPRISLPSHKMIAFRKSGISDVVVVPFDQEFASLTAEEFLDLVKTYTNPQEIIVGEGFRFGKARQGDGDYIKDYASRNGFSATVINRLESEDSIVSSSRIREALSSGNVERAESLLGRRFRLRGVVERGFARGRELGYPTANLMVVGELLVPDSGIYAGYVHIRNGVQPSRQGLIYIGTSPTFEPRDRTVEAHILDFDADLYARNIEVEFVARLRGDEQFASVEALLDQIRRDEEQARKIFRETDPESDWKDVT